VERHDAIREGARALEPDLVAWRRELHRHPELGFEEVRTAAFVERRLRDLGVEEIRTGVARTGVVGILRARSAMAAPVLLRADMDALPIQEVDDGREYGSTVPGKMHACGHDGHTAMLLGAATLLASRTADLHRDVVLCFQPGEEGMGGAREMIAEGVLDWSGAGSAFGLHLWSPFPVGTLHVRGGAIMAAQDEFAATVVGRGGHGALPHEARDPVVGAALGVTALQNVVARCVDPVRPAVATVGSMHAGSAPNVIPDRAHLRGTLRSFDEATRAVLRDRVEAALDGAARATGCELEFELRPGYPAVVNDVAAALRVRDLGRSVFGADRVVECPPVAAAEDFAYFLEAVPGAFAFVGAGNPERGITAPHHAPAFDIDEAALPLGAELLARIALDKPE
jgi:amidohydrolase